MDLELYRRWYDYLAARDAMLAATDSDYAPWYIVSSDDKRRARLNCIAQDSRPHSVQESIATEGQAAETINEEKIRRPGVAPGKEFCCREILI